jgi:hypothetical protein
VGRVDRLAVGRGGVHLGWSICWLLWEPPPSAGGIFLNSPRLTHLLLCAKITIESCSEGADQKGGVIYAALKGVKPCRSIINFQGGDDQELKSSKAELPAFVWGLSLGYQASVGLLPHFYGGQCTWIPLL